MSGGWCDDLTYGYLRRLLATARDQYEVRPVGEAPDPLEAGTLLLRHDVDVCLQRAVAVAELEAELGLRATYMVMTDGLLYRLDDADAKQRLATLAALGHEVGLHFDAPPGAGAPAEQEAAICEACERLETVTGTPVQSLSFHRPQPQYLRGPRRVAGRVNAYADDLMDGYVSDSRGRWCSEPLPRLLDRSRRLTQILIHPIWWADDHALAPDRLEHFFVRRTMNMSSDQRAAFDEALAATLPGVSRRGRTPREAVGS